MRLGVALSGGGVRGATHIGVLKAFEENGIRPNLISGASAGSIVAALYASGYSPAEMEKIFSSVDRSLIDFDLHSILPFVKGITLGRGISIDGLVRGEKIEKLIEDLTMKKGVRSISRTRIPLAVPAVDINTAETVMFTSNRIPNTDGVICDSSVKISEAVRASISLPLIFKPKILKGRRLVDGGVKENVPMKILKMMGANKVIAVNLGYCGERDESIDDIFEITGQTLDIMSYSIFKAEENYADVLIKPRIYNVQLLDIDKIPECITRGYEYALGIIPQIKSILYT